MMCDNCKIKDSIIETLLRQIKPFCGFEFRGLYPTLDAWVKFTMKIIGYVEQKIAELNEVKEDV